MEEKELTVYRYDDEQGSGDMTLADAYEHHKERSLDFVIGNGEVVEIWAAGRLLWSKKEPQAAGTAQGQ